MAGELEQVAGGRVVSKAGCAGVRLGLFGQFGSAYSDGAGSWSNLSMSVLALRSLSCSCGLEALLRACVPLQLLCTPVVAAVLPLPPRRAHTVSLCHSLLRTYIVVLVHGAWC